MEIQLLHIATPRSGSGHGVLLLDVFLLAFIWCSSARVVDRILLSGRQLSVLVLEFYTTSDLLFLVPSKSNRLVDVLVGSSGKKSSGGGSFSGLVISQVDVDVDVHGNISFVVFVKLSYSQVINLNFTSLDFGDTIYR